MGKKWNQDTKPAEKMLSLYSLLLFSRYELSLTELAKSLNCSKQTVCRLVDQLEASVYGKVIRTKRGREAFYHLDRPKDVPCLNLDAEGLEKLALCRDFVMHLLPESFKQQTEGALRLANSLVDPSEGQPVSPLPMGYVFYKGRIDYTPQRETFQTLMRAIKGHQVCSLSYKAAPVAEARNFEFAPQRIIAFHESIRILGWIVTEKGPVKALYENPAILPLHRILNTSLGQRSAAKLPDAIDSATGAFGLMSGEVFTARLKFQPEAAIYVAERQWSMEQKIDAQPDGSIILEMEAKSDLELISWVLSFGNAAEILSPEWLRQEITDRVGSLNQIYSESDQV